MNVLLATPAIFIFIAQHQTTGGLDLLQFAKAAGVAGFATMPFLAYWVMLNWNFKVGTVSYARAFNIVGALFSTILYSYYTFSEPKPNLLLLSLYWFYVPAVLCTVGYFALFFLFGEEVQLGKKRWVVPVAMLQYVVVLSIFAVLVSIVLKHKEYYLVGGGIAINGQPAVNQRVEWSVKYLPPDRPLQTVNEFRRTDGTGRYLISRRWSDMPLPNDSALNPVLVVQRSGAYPYEERLDQRNHIPWNINLIEQPGSR